MWTKHILSIRHIQNSKLNIFKLQIIYEENLRFTERINTGIYLLPVLRFIISDTQGMYEYIPINDVTDRYNITDVVNICKSE